jgi:hypothetical protein
MQTETSEESPPCGKLKKKKKKIKGKHCSPQESGSDTMLRFVNLKYKNKSGRNRDKIETNTYGWFGVRHLRPSL